SEGGRVRIGGGFQGRDEDVSRAETLRVAEGAQIRADGASGSGGQVILWSDGHTAFAGDISAQARGAEGRGGFVEVPGKETLLYEGLVSTLAGSGQHGTLLLDPTDFEVIAGGSAGANQITNTDLQAQLDLANVVIATDSAGAESGHITVESGATLSWSSGNSLALLAHGDIRFNAS